MKKLWIGLLAALLAVSALLCAAAEAAEAPAFDVELYSLDELREINAQVDERLAVLEREWAIEHGDRTVTFEEGEITLFAKKSQKLQPIVTRVVEDAPEKTSLTWSSSDDAIAKVNSEGTVTGVAKGDAVITATAKDNDAIFGSATVHVVLPVAKVVPESAEVTLLLNDVPADAEADLRVAIEPEDAYYTDVTWASSKEDVVTVDANGHVRGLVPGKSTITAASVEEGSGKKATINVTVVQAVRGITLTDAQLVIDKGKTARLKAEIAPEDATSKKVTWSSSDEEIARVNSEGSITARACGECDILCTAADGSEVSARCHVVVKQMVTSVKLSESKLTLPSGQSAQITATVSPEDATSRDIVWSSSDSSVASVTADGKVTAAKGGDCVITCAATDGSEKSATVSVHVPTFSVQFKEYVVTSKSGLTIPVDINGYYTIYAESSSSSFNFDWKGDDLFITPIRAGSGTIKLTNKEATQDNITIKINVDHSAVYDTTSYPKANYKDVLRNPGSYSGDNISVYGKVLQKTEGWGTVILRVGTGGYGYYDNVFWIEYNAGDIASNVIEDDYVTVYGKCTGTHTYETVMGASVTIPSIDAEQIIIGRK